LEELKLCGGGLAKLEELNLGELEFGKIGIGGFRNMGIKFGGRQDR